ncbi:MAG: efflux RND transporter permease subunit [Saprospiraceae bacterium]|nr:efflux RND transporter permease subunit [Saprospiraceae bacterium]
MSTTPSRPFFFNYRSPIAVLTGLLVLGGFYAYSRLQTALFPEITFPKIKIIADAGQQPVDKMMIAVTKPIEEAVKQVPDLKLLRSTTSRGSCELSAFIDWNADIDLAKQQIESKLNQARPNLPPELQVTVEKMNPSILPVMGYTLESKQRSPVELKQLALFTIKPFLSQVEGVSEVRIIGGKTKEYWLLLNVPKMSALGITPEQISATLTQTNFVQSNGYLSDYRYLYLTLTDAVVDKLDELENLVVSNDGKRITRLRDIADVQIQEAKEYVKINANGRDGILLAIVKQPNANLIALSDSMTSKVNELHGILPADVRVEPFYVQADFVKDAVKSVTDSLWIGLLLAIVVAMLFLRSLKASATLLVVVPVTLACTLLVLYAIGETFNIMTLGAIAAAIGLIIDDAIVVVEQIHRTQEEHPGDPVPELVQKALRYLLPAMIGSSISTMVIFLPFMLMSGVAGAYFKVMTDTMMITLACSFFVTWIALPVVYLLFSRKNNAAQAAHPHEETKRSWVVFFIQRPWLSAGFALLLCWLIVWVFPKLETGFLPDMDEGSIVLDYNSPPGTSLDETDQMLREVEKIIVQVPEVEAYSRRTGTQMGFFITEPNRGDYLIQLKKNRSRTSEEVIADIRHRIELTQPALTIDFGQVIGDMLGDLMASVQPIEVKIFGADRTQLQTLSQRAAGLITAVQGTADVFDGIIIAGPSVNVEPDFTRLAQFGITPANLQYQVQTALEGNVVGQVFEKQQLVNIRLQYPGSRTLSIAELRNLSIFLPTGKRLSLSDLATVNVSAGDAEVERENLQPLGVVSARLDNRDLGSTMTEIRRVLADSLNLPSGYHIQYGGAYAEQQQSFRELLLILLTASMLVFGVMLFLFRDFGVALLILLVAVLGIAGSYAALYLTHTPLNVGSYTGLIMIVGIIGENAIFTVLQFRDNLHSRGIDDALAFAISTRLRPKLMTALGAIIALMPLALGIGTGAQLHQPLAISVIGGFLAALPLLLVVLPAGLRIINGGRWWPERIRKERVKK